MSDNILDGLGAALRIQRVLDRIGRLHEVVDVDAGPLAEQPPEDAWQVEEERLDKEKDGNPLVVAEILPDGTRLAGNRVFRQVIGIRHPAHLVRILHVQRTHKTFSINDRMENATGNYRVYINNCKTKTGFNFFSL